MSRWVGCGGDGCWRRLIGMDSCFRRNDGWGLVGGRDKGAGHRLVYIHFRVPVRGLLCFNQLDAVSVAPKVRGVESHQPALAMRQHSGDDVGVVYLTASD